MIRTPSIAKPRSHLRHASRNSTSGRGHGGSKGDTGIVASVDKFLLGFRAVWCLAVIYAEVWVFHRAVERCDYPANFRYELTRTGSKPFKVLLIADPQILDLRSHPDNSYIFKHVAMWITDNYARKSWRMVMKQHRPDAVFFLGDLLDSGVEVFDRDEHSHYVHRFQNIFPPVPRKLPMYYVPGNHDLGLHLTRGGSAYARERFTETFGPLSGAVELGNHTIIWIDTPGLLEERTLAGDDFDKPTFRPSPGGVLEFLRSFQAAPHTLPRVLLSHIPLYRPEGTPCGPLRESRSNVRQGRGKNYQNEVDQAVSRYLLEATNPSLIFSGDDHDYCDVPHHLAMSSPREISCKSFSMAMEVRQPGYQLLSLLNPLDLPSDSTGLSSTHLTNLCLLPDQIGLYTYFYAPLAILTLLILAFPRVYYNLRSRRGTSARSNGLPMHTQSLSRMLRRPAVKPADEEDDDVSVNMSESSDDEYNNSYAGYPTSPAHTNYSYHSPTDDDYASMVTPREIMPRQGKSKVRRVSRVWLWDPKAADEDYLRFLKRLGPAYRYLIRPSERSLRRVFHKLYGKRLQLFVAKLNSGNVLGETIYDLGQIGWVALLMYTGIWIWYLR